MLRIAPGVDGKRVNVFDAKGLDDEPDNVLPVPNVSLFGILCLIIHLFRLLPCQRFLYQRKVSWMI